MASGKIANAANRVLVGSVATVGAMLNYPQLIASATFRGLVTAWELIRGNFAGDSTLRERLNEVGFFYSQIAATARSITGKFDAITKRAIIANYVVGAIFSGLSYFMDIKPMAAGEKRDDTMPLFTPAYRGLIELLGIKGLDPYQIPPEHLAAAQNIYRTELKSLFDIYTKYAENMENSGLKKLAIEYKLLASDLRNTLEKDALNPTPGNAAVESKVVGYNLDKISAILAEILNEQVGFPSSKFSLVNSDSISDSPQLIELRNQLNTGIPQRYTPEHVKELLLKEIDKLTKKETAEASTNELDSWVMRRGNREQGGGRFAA